MRTLGKGTWFHHVAMPPHNMLSVFHKKNSMSNPPYPCHSNPLIHTLHIHMHTNTHTHTHTRTHAHKHTLTLTLTHTHTHTHVHMHTNAHSHSHSHTHTLTHTLTHVPEDPLPGCGLYMEHFAHILVKAAAVTSSLPHCVAWPTRVTLTDPQRCQPVDKHLRAHQVDCSRLDQVTWW